jgi:hypothetical protein
VEENREKTPPPRPSNIGQEMGTLALTVEICVEYVYD